MRSKSKEEWLLRKKERMFARLMRELDESRAVLVVEGMRDERALRNIGVMNAVVRAHGTPDDIARRVAKRGDSAVVLTDFDGSGEELRLRITEALHAHGVRSLEEPRRAFRYIFGLLFFEEIDRKHEELVEKLREFER